MKLFYKQPQLTVKYLAADILTSSSEDSRFNLDWMTFESDGGVQ
jgi:hypothetical protein